MKKNLFNNYTIAIIILLAALSRLLPHPFNFTPITAIALFGSAYLGKKSAIIVPLAAMFISDLVIQLTGSVGFHSGTPLVYGTLALITLLGFITLRKVSALTVISSSLIGSVIFYLVTNFAFFYPTSLYPHSFNGIVASYTMAIPFFKNTVLGDLVYSGALFGGYYFIKQNSNIFKTT